MIRYIVYFFLLSIVLTESSCQQEVDEKYLPGPESKFVVGCFISPADTILKLSLSRSLSPGEIYQSYGGEVRVKDAIVTISDGVKTVVMTYTDSINYYTANAADLPVTSGKKYYITVSGSGLPEAKAECEIPNATVNNVTVEIDTIDNSDNNSVYAKMVNVNYKWQGTAENKYRIYATMKTTTVYPASDTVMQSFELYFPALRAGITDGSSGAETGPVTGIFPVYGAYESMTDATITSNIIILDNAYYEYFKSLGNTDLYMTGNLFREPYRTYTNVRGGLGVFAGYNVYTRYDKLK
jgi:hypothetical protein